MEDEFEHFRDDLIAYLAARLQMSREDVLEKLGDWLVGAPATKTRLGEASVLRSTTHPEG